VHRVRCIERKSIQNIPSNRSTLAYTHVMKSVLQPTIKEQEPSSTTMIYDSIYEYTGHVGRFQLLMMSFMFAVTVFSMDVMNMIFVGGQMNHWCLVDELSSLTPDQQKYIAIPAVPESNDGDVIDDIIVYSSCEVFDVNWTTYEVDELANWNRTQWIEGGGNGSTIAVRQCGTWNYDQSVFTSTVVSRVWIVD